MTDEAMLVDTERYQTLTSTDEITCDF